LSVVRIATSVHRVPSAGRPLLQVPHDQAGGFADELFGGFRGQRLTAVQDGVVGHCLDRTRAQESGKCGIRDPTPVAMALE
jgi:hypothetical protein